MNSAIEALAAQLGLPAADARRGAEALLPSVVAGMGDAAGGPDLAKHQGLEASLLSLGGGGLADNVIGPDETEVHKGNDILGQIFGSKDVSRQVADNASQSSGLNASLLKRMLPILAMLVAGHLAKRSNGQQGGLEGILGTVLGSLAGSSGMGGGPARGAAPAGGGLGGILGSILGRR